jgi:hypothetical protein
MNDLDLNQLPDPATTEKIEDFLKGIVATETQQTALRCTIDMIRAVSFAATTKSKRGYTDFLASQIVQAGTCPTLLDFIQKLANLLQADLSQVYRVATVAFMKRINDSNAPSVLEWIRANSTIIALMVTFKKEDYLDSIHTLPTISVSAQDKGVAIAVPSCDIDIHIACLSPLCHGSDEKAGNATLYMREAIKTDKDCIISLPIYSANALKNQMRDLLADHFTEAMGFKVSRDTEVWATWFFHLLYGGGALVKSDSTKKKTGLEKELGTDGNFRTEGIVKFRNMFPFFSAWGCSLTNRMLAARFKTYSARPKCTEWNNGGTEPAAELFEWTFVTRHEDLENYAEGNHSGMIAKTECLRTGTELISGINISQHATDCEVACIIKGLQLLKTEAAIGGKTNGGFGRVHIQYQYNLDRIADETPNSFLYDEYLKNNKEKIIEYLNNIGAFASQEEKEDATAVKSKKTKKAKAETEPIVDPLIFDEV